MKITIEMEDTDPKLPAVLAAIGGGAAVVNVANAPAETKAPVTPPKTTTKPKAEEPKADEAQDEGNASAASSDAPAQPKTTAPSQASTSAPSKDTGDDKIDLPKLQGLAAILLEAGERRTLKSVLDENGVKSLSTAPEDAYEMLFDGLTAAVAALPA